VSEQDRLEAIAANSRYALGLNTRTTEYAGRIFARWWRGGSCLELGPAEGVMTELLPKEFTEITVVEGSERFCRDLRARFPAMHVVHSLFEEFRPEGRFDAILLGQVLEHVEDPVALLRRAGTWLSPGGRIFASVPNARSVHRQAAVAMGLLPIESALNEADRAHGHRRVYDPEAFRADFLAAGLAIDAFGGFWLKPLSNAQMEATWTPAMVDAFLRLGERYPDIAGEIYIIASTTQT
jgi:2-polyprenyl-3-methyl-5-hydroxy-6-metoxy-1,4-benzoquinol methylase